MVEVVFYIVTAIATVVYSQKMTIKCRLILKYINDTLWKSCIEMCKLIDFVTLVKNVP